MKRILATLGLVLLSISVFAQEDALKAAQQAMAEARKNQAAGQQTVQPVPDYWKKSIQFDLGFNQTALFNWAAGGYNTVTARTALDAKFDYAKDHATWKNRLQLEFGFLYSSDKPWPLVQKDNDRMYLESKWAYQTSKDSKFKYTASFDFRSQFAPGYNYGTPSATEPKIDDWKAARTLKSDLLSPAYTNLALGIEWIPAPWLDINLAPLTGGFTIVNNPDLRANYGMPLKDASITAPVGADYRLAMFQFGAQLKTDVKLLINEKFKFESQLVVFTDYLHEPYFRVNWDNKIEWQLTKLFKAGLYTWLLYDPRVKLDDGTPRGVQFKENAALSFSYTLQPKGLFKHQPRGPRNN